MTTHEIRTGNGTLTLQRKYFSVQKILLTPVCLLAEIKLPKNVAEDEFEATKNEIYQTLRSISQTAGDHDLLRPVVGWVKKDGLAPEIIAEIKKWEADQEWHQGDFLLYVQPSDADADETGAFKHLIEELKNSAPDMFKIRWEKNQSAREFLEQFAKKHLESFYDEQKELFERLDRVISRDAVSKDEIKRDIKISLNRWKDTVLSRAEKAGGLS